METCRRRSKRLCIRGPRSVFSTDVVIQQVWPRIASDVAGLIASYCVGLPNDFKLRLGITGNKLLFDGTTDGKMYYTQHNSPAVLQYPSRLPFIHHTTAVRAQALCITSTKMWVIWKFTSGICGEICSYNLNTKELIQRMYLTQELQVYNIITIIASDEDDIFLQSGDHKMYKISISDGTAIRVFAKTSKGTPIIIHSICISGPTVYVLSRRSVWSATADDIFKRTRLFRTDDTHSCLKVSYDGTIYVSKYAKHGSLVKTYINCVLITTRKIKYGAIWLLKFTGQNVGEVIMLQDETLYSINHPKLK